MLPGGGRAPARPAHLTRRRTSGCRCCCSCTVAASRSAASETHDSLCRQLALRAASPSSHSTTGSRRSTGSRPPSTTPGRRWVGWRATARRSARRSRLAVGGDSAGGTLVVCALHARDIGLASSRCSCSSRPAPQRSPTRRRTRPLPTATCSTRRPSPGSSTTTSTSRSAGTGACPAARRRRRRRRAGAARFAECDPLVDEGLAYADRQSAAGGCRRTRPVRAA